MGDGKILHVPDVQQRQPEPGCACECHERMGNDFYFLPTGSCLRADKRCNRELP